MNPAAENHNSGKFIRGKRTYDEMTAQRHWGLFATKRFLDELKMAVLAFLVRVKMGKDVGNLMLGFAGQLGVPMRCDFLVEEAAVEHIQAEFERQKQLWAEFKDEYMEELAGAGGEITAGREKLLVEQMIELDEQIMKLPRVLDCVLWVMAETNPICSDDLFLRVRDEADLRALYENVYDERMWEIVQIFDVCGICISQLKFEEQFYGWLQEHERLDTAHWRYLKWVLKATGGANIELHANLRVSESNLVGF